MRRILGVALGLVFVSGFVARVATGDCSPTLFVQAQQYFVGADPEAITTGDFNGDDLPDVAVVNRSQATVSVLLNAGDGTFEPAIDSNAGNGFFGIAAADFDDDGALDLAVGGHGNVSILLGEGDGSFADPVSYPAGNSSIQSIQTARLDDGDTTDILVGDEAGAVVVLLGDGDGTFQPQASFPADGRVRAIAVGHFDGNDLPDVVASHQPGNTVTLLLGFGDGTFAPPISFIAGSDLGDLVTGDFDGDDDADVAVASGAYVSILKGNGLGSFGAALQYWAGGGNIRALVAGDFDAGDALDLVVLRDDGSFFGSANVLSTLLGDGTGRFAVGRSYLVGRSSFDLATADFNDDDLLDVAVTDEEEDTVWILRSNGPGTFEGASVVDVADSIRNFTGGDFSGDQRPDIAAVNGGQVLMYLGNATGGFDPGEIYSLGGAAYVGSFDVDLDFQHDLLVSMGSGFPGLWFLKGNGDGTFTPAPEGIQADAYTGPWVARHFDAGATQDVVVVHGCCGFGGIDILLGNGDGTFQPPVNIDLGATPTSIVAADFNHDLKEDVAVTVFESSQVVVLFGNGDGTFQAPVPYPVGSGPVWLGLGFVGTELGLVTANSGSQSVSVLRSNFDGTFLPAKQIGLGVSPTFAGLYDFDGDNVADLYTTNGNASSVYVLIGNPDGVFASPEEFHTGREAVYAEVARLDDNNKPDLIVATPGSSDLTLLYNAQLGGAIRPHPPVCTGSTAQLEVEASGFGPVTYQWLKDGFPLVDGGSISGALTATLTISPVSEADAGTYQVELTDSCTTVFSDSALLQVVGAPPAPIIDVFVGPVPGIPGMARVFADPSVSVFEWSAVGAVIVDGQGTSIVTFLAAEPGTVDLGITISFGAGCATSSGSVPVPVDYLDVPPSNPFHDDIVTIGQEGVTAGCGGGNYCPTDPVRRDQMAVFLLKSEHGADYTPPPCTGVFDDVPCPGPFTDWVEQLAAEGVTGGCGGDDYCPSQSVTRAQMALFLLKTSEGSGYTPPPATGIFGDVPVGSFAADFIEDLYTRGITGGCSLSPLLYCPDSAVLRQQMAAFLVRTFFP